MRWIGGIAMLTACGAVSNERDGVADSVDTGSDTGVATVDAPAVVWTEARQGLGFEVGIVVGYDDGSELEVVTQLPDPCTAFAEGRAQLEVPGVPFPVDVSLVGEVTTSPVATAGLGLVVVCGQPTIALHLPAAGPYQFTVATGDRMVVEAPGAERPPAGFTAGPTYQVNARAGLHQVTIDGTAFAIEPLEVTP